MSRRVKKAWKQGRRGAVIVMVAVSGTLVAGFAALTIDLGNMYMAQAELQRAADAAALAAAAKLTHYQAGTSEAAAAAEAKKIVEANPVMGKTVTIDKSEDVIFGRAVWDNSASRYNFTAGGTVPTAVRVQIRLTSDSPNGALSLMFAGIWGQSSRGMMAKASAMIVPRDISVVADLSGSMDDDSELLNYKQTEINLWNIWVCLPIEKGNNGVGNGIDPPPPGNPPLNDGYGTGPGDPGNRGGADPRTDPGLMGPTWGRLNTWGTLIIDSSSYNPTQDPGLEYLPYRSSWTSDTTLKNWFQDVGYSTSEVNALLSSSYDTSYYQYRVAVALGLARWDSGKSGGLWSKLPAGKTKNTKGNGDDRISSNELAWLVDYPYPGGSWLEYIDDYMTSTGTYMYSGDSRLRYRFGLKTFVNYLLEYRSSYADTPDLYKTPEQPLKAVKDAVSYCMNLITQQESDDQVSLEIFGQTAHHMQNLTKSYSLVSDTLNDMQSDHYDGWTNTAGGINLAISELTSGRARANAAKVCFLLSDGQANVNSRGGAGDVSGGKSYALQCAQNAVNQGIQFYCVSMGADADRPFMQQIAEMGGGEEFFASGSIDQYSTQLKDIFAELGSRRPVRLID